MTFSPEYTHVNRKLCILRSTLEIWYDPKRNSQKASNCRRWRALGAFQRDAIFCSPMGRKPASEPNDKSDHVSTWAYGDYLLCGSGKKKRAWGEPFQYCEMCLDSKYTGRPFHQPWRVFREHKEGATLQPLTMQALSVSWIQTRAQTNESLKISKPMYKPDQKPAQFRLKYFFLQNKLM